MAITGFPEGVENVLGDDAGSDVVLGELGQGQGLVGRGGFGGGVVEADEVLLLLVGQEEKGPITEDRSAERTAIVLVAQWQRGPRRASERRGDGQRLVAVVVVSVSVELIGAGLRGDIQVAARATAGFAAAGGLERVLVERFNGIDNSSDAADAALVDGDGVEVQVVVVGAVDGVVELVAAGAVDRAVVAIAGEGDRGALELRKVATVERNILQRLTIEDGGLHDGSSVERKRIGGHFDGGRLLCDSQLDRQRINFPGLHLHASDLGGLETGGLYLHRVGALWQIAKQELTGAG